jgi:hypothetical protein
MVPGADAGEGTVCAWMTAMAMTKAVMEEERSLTMIVIMNGARRGWEVTMDDYENPKHNVE